MTFYKNNAPAIDEKIWSDYAKNRNIDLRNQILNSYLYIVSINIKRMNIIPSHCQDIEDITDHGILELIKCIDRYDYSKGIQFDTYASIRIRGSIIDYIRKKDWVPQDIRKRVGEMNGCAAQFRAEKSREPNDRELSELLGIDIEELHEIQRDELSMNFLDFEELICDSKTNNSEDKFDTSKPEDKALDDELKSVIAQYVDGLDSNEKTVISLYYYEGLKFKEIAFVMDLTPSRITQIHMKALSKLKEKISRYMA